MANKITEACVNCGACESVCPSGGISKGPDIYVIDPALCSECVGFHHTQQCERVCPVDCCVVDPDNPETEEVLFERAQKLHAGSGRKLQLGPETSRFRADQRTLGSALGQLARRFGDLFQGPPSSPARKEDE
ncbi:MAG: 4Fe-4S ferredoxin [Proteobacteria bacterium]|nr:MAG: 4Fe-4S ferredoxin [Pseudomonadota bacterium]